MDSTTISLFSQIFRGTGRDAINGQKKCGAKAHAVIKADEDNLRNLQKTLADRNALQKAEAELSAQIFPWR